MHRYLKLHLNKFAFPDIMLKLMFYRLFCLALLTLTVSKVKASHCDSIGGITDTLQLSLKREAVYTDSIVPQIKKNRIYGVAAMNIVGYGGSMALFYQAWYKNYPRSGFHTINDNKEWLQVDKVGHVYGAYIESKASMEIWRWAGLPRKKRIWIGGMSGAIYQTVIETLDGYSAGWGWSWGDFAANIAGSGIFVAQELAWDQQKIQMKFSFHKADYSGDPQIAQQVNTLFGRNTANRMIKDYGAQTYWLSGNIKSFLPKAKVPNWLNLAVGYGAQNIYGPFGNVWDDPIVLGNVIDKSAIPRYRQWYLAPDIDFTQIKTKSKFLKVAFFVLNSFKFPTPSLELSQGKLRWNWLHF